LDHRRLAAALVAALPAFALSWQMFRVLQAPLEGNHPRWVADAQILMWTEFVLMHAAIFAVWLNRSTRGFAAFLGLVYFPLMFGFWKATNESSVVVIAAFLLASRLVVPLIHRAGLEELAERFGIAIIGMGAWFFVMSLTVGKPNGAVAFCALYFLINGLLELRRLFGPSRAVVQADADARVGSEDGPMLRFTSSACELSVERRPWMHAYAPLGIAIGLLGMAVTAGPLLGMLILLPVGVFFYRIWRTVGYSATIRAQRDELLWIDGWALDHHYRLANANISRDLQVAQSADGSWRLHLAVEGQPAIKMHEAISREQEPAEALRKVLLVFVENGADVEARQRLLAEPGVRRLLGDGGGARFLSPVRVELPPIVR
jgi:hypothetical protein